ncbi:MAG: hypothetical protein WAV00_07090 [Nocardioides sp.]
MRRLKTLGSALLVAAVLVMGANYVAYAATGHAFILGKTNKADKVTTLARTTNGTVLKLTTKNSGAAPLVTNGRGKVTNLNADRVDGVHASALGVNTLLFTTPISKPSAPSFVVTLANVAKGNYLVNGSGFIYGSRAAGIRCDLIVDGTQQLYDWFDVATGQNWADLNMSGMISVPATQDLTFQCLTNDSSNTDWSSYSASPLKIALTKIKSLTTRTPSVAKNAQKSATKTGPSR